jgi:hypothetical protein
MSLLSFVLRHKQYLGRSKVSSTRKKTIKTNKNTNERVCLGVSNEPLEREEMVATRALVVEIDALHNARLTKPMAALGCGADMKH